MVHEIKSGDIFDQCDSLREKYMQYNAKIGKELST